MSIEHRLTMKQCDRTRQQDQWATNRLSTKPLYRLLFTLEAVRHPITPLIWPSTVRICWIVIPLASTTLDVILGHLQVEDENDWLARHACRIDLEMASSFWETWWLGVNNCGQLRFANAVRLVRMMRAAEQKHMRCIYLSTCTCTATGIINHAFRASASPTGRPLSCTCTCAYTPHIDWMRLMAHTRFHGICRWETACSGIKTVRMEEVAGVGTLQCATFLLIATASNLSPHISLIRDWGYEVFLDLEYQQLLRFYDGHHVSERASLQIDTWSWVQESIESIESIKELPAPKGLNGMVWNLSYF